jgi:hypothetical protein
MNVHSSKFFFNSIEKQNFFIFSHVFSDVTLSLFPSSSILSPLFSFLLSFDSSYSMPSQSSFRYYPDKVHCVFAHSSYY